VANNILAFIPANGNESWLSNEKVEVLDQELLQALEAHHEGTARYIIDGKICRVSMPQQIFWVEDPAGGAPRMIKPVEPPTFDANGQVVFLIRRPPGGD